MIRLWQGHKELYQVNHPEYADKHHRSLLLTQMGDKLNTTSNEVYKKMRGLKTYYQQLCRAQKGKSGDAAKKEPKWPFFESMKFVEFLIAESAGTDSATIDFSTTTPTAFRRQEVKRRKKSAEATDQSSLTPLIERVVEAFEKDGNDGSTKEPEVDNEDTHFAKMICAELSKIADGQRKDDAKMKILLAVHELKRNVRDDASS